MDNILFLVFLFLLPASKAQTVSDENQFDSLKTIENGETVEIFGSGGPGYYIGDTVETYFKRLMQNGHLIDFRKINYSELK